MYNFLLAQMGNSKAICSAADRCALFCRQSASTVLSMIQFLFRRGPLAKAQQKVVRHLHGQTRRDVILDQRVQF